jgi:hypothetical protein
MPRYVGDSINAVVKPSSVDACCRLRAWGTRPPRQGAQLWRRELVAPKAGYSVLPFRPCFRFVLDPEQGRCSISASSQAIFSLQESCVHPTPPPPPTPANRAPALRPPLHMSTPSVTFLALISPSRARLGGSAVQRLPRQPPHPCKPKTPPFAREPPSRRHAGHLNERGRLLLATIKTSRCGPRESR